MKRLKIFADNLFAHELLHLGSGILAFFVLVRRYGQIRYGVIAFLVSLLIDTDHFFESLIFNRSNPFKIFSNYPHVYWQKLGKMTLLFHSWELLVLFYAVSKLAGFEPLALAVVFPATLHYLIDSFIYGGFRQMPLLLYFLTYRIYHRFDFKKLCSTSED